MLIEFSVTNFLSFREKQTLSMVADKAKELEETHTFQPIGKAKLPRLLHATGIYGANASGKSNLLRAMKVMRKIVLSSANYFQASELIREIMPYALSEDEPTEFEIIFIANEVRYQYGFAATRQQITEEWLFAFPSGRSQQWLSRVYDADLQEYHWLINATQVKGERELWKKSTRDDALFLSTAAQLNSEQFSVVLEWFEHNLREGGLTNTLSPDRTLHLCRNPNGKAKVLQFMNSADISISNIEISRSEDEDILQWPLHPSDITFWHQTPDGRSFQLPSDRESTGTRRLFGNAGVWLDVLEQGQVICIDELESSLHPLLTRYIVSLFHNPEMNPHHAQLIFTTHDATILDNEILRRDQIWFVEKDNEQMTRLYPLSDFSPRKDEALQKGYLQGRYGALPYLSSANWLK